MKKTLGISPCPNDVYVFAGLILGHIAPDFEIDFADVQTLNERAAAGAYDLVKISYAAYPAIEKDYVLLPCGGALGRGCGPLLLTNGRQSFDASAPVLVPGAGTTASFLLDFWAQRPLEKEFAFFDEVYERLLSEPLAQGVVIHEKRFTYARDGLTLLADLGEYWERQTGFAIPLGAIAARREVAFEREAARLIRASLAWSDTHPTEALALCREHAAELDESVMRAHISLYVNDFTRDLGPEGEAAVAHFLTLANKAFDKRACP